MLETSIPFWKRLLPIIFFEAYLFFTILLLTWGPWRWHIRNAFEFYLFLINANVALFIGYFIAIGKQPGGYSSRFSVESLVKGCLIINLILLLPTSYMRTGSWIPNISYGLTNPGPAYNASLVWRGSHSPFIEYLRILFRIQGKLY
jgi:hypothetical protein